MAMRNVTANSYPYLKRITARKIGLAEVPEALGSLPCLAALDLSENQLGQAKNWNFLNSPFIRENLLELWLDHCGVSIVTRKLTGYFYI